MALRSRTHQSAAHATLAILFAAIVCAGTAHAKPWHEWAPGALTSDSTYAALSAWPSELLSDDARRWIAVQRHWRAQREGEVRGAIAAGATSITGAFPPHRERPGDERFARLIAQPLDALSTADRAWLFAENAAQRKGERFASDSAPEPAEVAVLAIVAGFVGAWLLLGAAFGSFPSR